MGKKRLRVFGLVVALLLISMGGNRLQSEVGGKPPGQETDQNAQYVPGEVLVKFKGMPALPEDILSSAPHKAAAAVDLLPPDARFALGEIQGQAVKFYPVIGVFLVRLQAAMPVSQAVEHLVRTATVEYAEPNYRVSIHAIPNDPRFHEQWGLNNTGQTAGTPDADIDAPEAWNLRKSSAATIVAVMDTGVNYLHEDLAANMWKNPKEAAGTNGVDDDGNNYVDDLYGIDIVNHDSDPMDDNGHGSHCAGIIGAKGNNGKGVAGVGWMARIMSLKVYDATGSGQISSYLEAITYLLNIKATYHYPRIVLNLSGGGYSASQSFFDAIVALRNAGVLFVAAAGNDGLPFTATFPARYEIDNIISVGASNHKDMRCAFSNWDTNLVDLYAPGENILSTTLGNNYESWSGTSMATPFVTGACALIWSQYPGLGWRAVKGLILNGVNNGYSESLGFYCATGGRLNLKRSINGTILNYPAIFSVFPVHPHKEFPTITLTGSKFGAAMGTLKFKGHIFPAASIKKWTDTEIVAKVTIGFPVGWGRLTVTTAEGTSRGIWLDQCILPPAL